MDHVVIFRLDRLSRSPKLTHTLLEDVFLKHDVGLTSITEGFDASTKEGRMLVGMLAAVAAYYLDCMAENIREGLMARRTKGRYATEPPYGWQWREVVDPDGSVRRGDAIEVVPEQAKWVKQMAEWLLAGWGTARIARELNRRGVRTKRGKQWQAKGVAECLRSPVHCGLMWAGDELVAGEHAAMRIYPPERREAILRTLQERAPVASRTKGATHVLLGGIARCGKCGRQLQVHYAPRKDRTGRRTLSYRCRGNERVGEGQCRGFSKAMERVDQWVVARVLEFAASPDMARMTEEAARREAGADRERLERDVEQLRGRLTELEAGFERWAEALTAGAMTVDQFRERNERMLEERAGIEAQLAEAESKLRSASEHEQVLAQVQEALRNLPEVWGQLDPEERKEVLRLLVRQLTIQSAGVGKVAVWMRLTYGPVIEGSL